MGETYALPRFSRPTIIFLVGAPLAWALLLLLHPMGEPDTIYLNLEDEVTRMLVVHVGMLLFLPLLAVAVFLLLRGVEGTGRRPGRSWCRTSPSTRSPAISASSRSPALSG